MRRKRECQADSGPMLRCVVMKMLVQLEQRWAEGRFLGWLARLVLWRVVETPLYKTVEMADEKVGNGGDGENVVWLRRKLRLIKKMPFFRKVAK